MAIYTLIELLELKESVQLVKPSGFQMDGSTDLRGASYVSKLGTTSYDDLHKFDSDLIR
jgi:hypothetical protein